MRGAEFVTYPRDKKGMTLPLFIQGRGRLGPSISDGTAFKTSQRPPLSGEGAAVEGQSLPPTLVIKRE